jgi:hypothetical protein
MSGEDRKVRTRSTLISLMQYSGRLMVRVDSQRWRQPSPKRTSTSTCMFAGRYVVCVSVSVSVSARACVVCND